MEAAGNIPVAAQLLEQAAKEVGDVFTNRRATEVIGKDGGPVEGHVVFNLKELSDEDLRALHDELSREDDEP
jgi:hypothetical protein